MYKLKEWTKSCNSLDTMGSIDILIDKIHFLIYLKLLTLKLT
jgi:hypothetical protein